MQKVVTHRGKRVAYGVVGDGKPLLLLHGFGFDSRIWSSMAPLLSKTFKVITPDMPGAGESETPNGEPSVGALADAMAAIIAEECSEPCLVVGHSMGGYVALAIKERHPDLVDAFGLFHSHPFADDEARKAKRDKDIDFIKRHGSAGYIKVLLPGLFGDSFKKQNPEAVNDLVDRYALLSPEGLIYALQAMKGRPDRSHVVSASEKPFLFIAGVQDQVVTMETVEKIYKMPQYTYGLFIREAAHMGMVESLEPAIKHLANWLHTLPQQQ